MVKYKSGEEAKIGDSIKFDHDGEPHFGIVKKVEEDGELTVGHVSHALTSVEHDVKASDAELVHNKR